jgi:peptidoglycan/LPS O-acetylase OafA/YrhL
VNSSDTSRNGKGAQQEASTEKPGRLHYLDWLQVLAILGVFLFHTAHSFDDLPAWHIENAEASILATFFGGFFILWGLLFTLSNGKQIFFGNGSWSLLPHLPSHLVWSSLSSSG